MIVKDIQEVKNSFNKYNNFQECIIENLILKDYFTTLEMSINNVWASYGQIRDDLDTKKEIVQLKFKGLNNLRLFNDLKEPVLSQLDRINWGFNEVALAKIESEENSFIKVLFLWESKRVLEITFKEFELFTM